MIVLVNITSKYADDNGVEDNAPSKVKSLYKIIKDGKNTDYKLYYKAVANAGKGIKSYDYVTAEIEKTDGTIIYNRYSYRLL